MYSTIPPMPFVWIDSSFKVSSKELWDALVQRKARVMREERLGIDTKALPLQCIGSVLNHAIVNRGEASFTSRG